MKAINLDLTRASGPDTNILSTTLSFRKFIDFVKESAQQETSLKRTFLEQCVGILDADGGLSTVNSAEQATQFPEQLEIVYQLLTLPLHQQENTLWAIGMPLSPIMFYGTDDFYDMVIDKKTGDLSVNLLDNESVKLSLRDQVLPLYSLILKRLYSISAPSFKPLVINISDRETSMPRYLRINIDNRFTDVYPIGPLPEIDLNLVHQLLTGNGDFSQLMSLLPAELFHLEGISIITLTDVTADYALDHIRTTMLEMNQYDQDFFYRQITDSLRVLSGSPDIHFGLIPQLQINDKPIADRSTIYHSKLIEADLREDLVTDIYSRFSSHFERFPDTIFIPGVRTDGQLEIFVREIKTVGIEYYLIMPVYNDQLLVGLFEIYSTEKIVLDENAFSRINLAKPLLSKIFQNVIDDFNNKIEIIVKEKFTSIQPAVQWKFQQAAWHFLRDNGSKNSVSIEKVVFENVYPLYGAIDIRNSTVVRNLATRKDLEFQFNLIVNLLKRIAQKMNLLLADEILFKCEIALKEISEGANLDEMKIAEFLETEVHAFLRHFLEDHASPDFSNTLRQKNNQDHKHILLSIQEYFDNNHTKSGACHVNRRHLEKSMQMINAAVNTALDSLKSQLEALYPAYFETFRTDGVEYDIYIGQSIDPDRKFSTMHL
ncbi:MAG: hypothetical protein ABIN24_14230, partial [Dyadobacter sp.]